jgi:hypothetical protein
MIQIVIRSTALLVALIFQMQSVIAQKDGREYYQLTIYTYQSDKQKQVLDHYLEKAWLPAMHKAGFSSIGIFSPIDDDTAIRKRIFILTPYPNLSMEETIQNKLAKDLLYQQEGEKYLKAAWNDPPFVRKQVQWMKAFPMAPRLKKPSLRGDKKDHVYEFRSYEGPTEAYYRNKVEMFNEGGEVPLFERLGFNAIFYAEVIAGDRMPNLAYMTSFENMEERNRHWKTFTEDAEWKNLVGMEKYQHNVSKADILLLKAAAYSDY